MWMCLAYANIWHKPEGRIARRCVVRRRQPHTWPVKDGITDINPLIYTEEYCFIICQCRLEYKLELFVLFVPRLVVGRNFVTKQLEQIYCAVIYPYVSCLMKACIGNVTKLCYDSAHLSWILLWLYINISRTHLQTFLGLSSANFVNVSTSVFIKYIFSKETFAGTFSCRQNKLELLSAIIHWFISLWGILYCFLQKIAWVIDSIFMAENPSQRSFLLVTVDY
jgi:hypothetical protein